MRRGFGTPVIWEHDGRTDLVVPGTFWLIGYHPDTGEERWRVSGLARITCTSPVIGDGMLLTSSWTTGGDRSADRITMPPFDEVLTARDRDGDGSLTFEELPEGAAKQRFKHLDGNRNQKVERSEWESMAAIFAKVENQSFAVVPDARGQVSDAGVRWRFKKGLPYVASPVLYRGRFYQVKNGGLMTCLDPKTGVPLYQEERLDAPGDYYASLLAADGRIYATSQRGVITVLRAGDALEVLARNDLSEPVHASPVAVGSQLLVRTASRLYSFQEAAPAGR
jgi:outer membrane protein assembly factor BamB